MPRSAAHPSSLSIVSGSKVSSSHISNWLMAVAGVYFGPTSQPCSACQALASSAVQMPRADSLLTPSPPLLQPHNEKSVTIEKIKNVLVILVVIGVLLVIKLAYDLLVTKDGIYGCCVLYHFVSTFPYFVSKSLYLCHTQDRHSF